MKRYRVLSFSFDTRAVMLNMPIQEDWEERVKDQWNVNKRKIREGLIQEFGAANCEQKIENFCELGANPISILAFHNAFLSQCRNAFVMESYYPALVSTCTLGERILNRLILHLREYFRRSPEYKNVYKKDSFQNWGYAIDTLQSWGVLLPEPADEFRELEGYRNNSIHFNPETDDNARELAAQAVKLIQGIVERQFSAFGNQPWYIAGVKGGAYVSREYEEEPFVKEIVIPNCALVGPKHKLSHGSHGWVVHDDFYYEDREVSDEEFASLVEQARA